MIKLTANPKMSDGTYVCGDACTSFRINQLEKAVEELQQLVTGLLTVEKMRWVNIKTGDKK